MFGHDTSKRRRTGKQVWANPYRWNMAAMSVGAPVRVFCASLADVFEDAPGPNQWRPDVWKVMKDNSFIDWQILTKRPENITKMLPDDWGDHGYKNVWLGTSIEDDRVAERGPILTEVPAFNHFVSYEPAIGPLETLKLDEIDWLIVGGESGPGYRPMQIEWAQSMMERCISLGVAFFAKQDAAFRTETPGRLAGWPRQYPKSWDRQYAVHIVSR